ncbi:TPA: hypothetical protein KR283_003781 [Clostridioides difficile]|jgi:hypothetical protein|uniref:Uncharacterized protein n=3 Tax=root TaxID=1 RepID=A0A0A8WIL2_9CAUD|nr:hypothetical protein [Clostridioides difficile]YP_002290941.1 hypothetical protein phiCD27_gp65 [Clostridioides phage phiCD27]YP_009214263.1 hypothetical protein PHIMMP03_20079 [Clostridium phage phiMMP03]ACH91356.1 hypothetical protein [Clostridioides phage phiCD27]AUA20382.1 hypothetical protein CWR55_01115 [Clostridioides difficile]AXU78494.1 hypothetical protein CDIF29688_01134 [Clostridioides difficile]AYC92208.1 hypothetical protein DA418_00735 [Clostridioides difficile]EGT3641215.1
MNKRIKMKKRLIHKKCDERCVNYDFVISNNLITCNVCIGCKYKENMDKVCEENYKKLRSK